MSVGMKAVADAIAGGESGGDYGAQNPTSSAHGRYQMTSATEAEVSRATHIYGEDPKSQDQKFAYLATRTYRQQTGRDLVADADSGQFDAQIAEALKGIWPSLPGGSQSNTSMLTYLRRIRDARAAYGPQARQTGTPRFSAPYAPLDAYTPDPSLFGGSAPAAVRSSVTNDNSRSNQSSVETHINGGIQISTAATDSDGIAKGIGESLKKYA